MNNVVINPYEYFADPTKGRPIFNGSIYVGVPDTDPEVPANQKQVYARQENGTEVAIPQPVATNAGGYPTYNGSVIGIVVNGPHSLKVNNKDGSQILYSSNNYNGVATTEDYGSVLLATDAQAIAGTPNVIPDAEQVRKNHVAQVATIAALRLLEPAFDGQQCELLGHTVAGIGGGMFYADYSSSASDDNGVTVVTASGRRWVRKLDGYVTPSMFGAGAGSSPSDRLPFQAAEDFSSSNGIFVRYEIDYTIALEHAEGSFYPVGVICRDNSKTQFLGGSLSVNDTASIGYQVFQIWDRSNVELHLPKIIGDKLVHTGVTGEFGMGLDIRGSDNVKIIMPEISNCWGDGIYIGTGTSSNPCVDVYIERPTLKSNRRQGISVINVDGLDIVSPVIEDTQGTNPQAGIDFEPDSNTDVLKNIFVTNPVTRNNSGSGIVFALQNLDATSDDISVTITGHSSLQEKSGFEVEAVQAGVGGFVKYIDSKLTLSEEAGIYIGNKSYASFKLYIDRPEIFNANTTGVGSVYGSGIVINSEAPDANYGNTGNVIIMNPRIVDDRPTKLTPHAVYANCFNGNKVEHLEIIDPVEVSGMLTSDLFIVANSFDMRDIREIFSQSVTSSQEMSVANIKSAINNYGAVGGIVYETPTSDKFPEITFKVESANLFRITPDPTEFIRPITSVAGATISSSQLGASITIKKDATNEWRVVNIVGNWATP